MTKKFYEDLQTGELLTTKDLEERFKEGHVAIDRFDKYVEHEINTDMIQEVFLSLEEIDGLLTETQNQITLETYVPYDMFDEYEEKGGDGCPYDSLFFTVPYSWYLQYLEDNYTIDQLQHEHSPKPNEDLDDAFMNDYVFEDSISMYEQAKAEGVIIETTLL